MFTTLRQENCNLRALDINENRPFNNACFQELCVSLAQCKLETCLFEDADFDMNIVERDFAHALRQPGCILEKVGPKAIMRIGNSELGSVEIRRMYELLSHAKLQRVYFAMLSARQICRISVRSSLRRLPPELFRLVAKSLI